MRRIMVMAMLGCGGGATKPEPVEPRPIEPAVMPFCFEAKAPLCARDQAACTKLREGLSATTECKPTLAIACFSYRDVMQGADEEVCTVDMDNCIAARNEWSTSANYSNLSECSVTRYRE